MSSMPPSCQQRKKIASVIAQWLCNSYCNNWQHDRSTGSAAVAVHTSALVHAKCPYCDFNSHEGFTESLQQPYIDALLADLDSQQAWWRDRPIESIFIGGGTPSLFEGRWLGTLLEGVSNRATPSRHVEITLESNPGSAESSRFAEYRAAGVNRLSIGVQSFDDRALQALGRIHSGNEARRALDMVATAGFAMEH